MTFLAILLSALAVDPARPRCWPLGGSSPRRRATRSSTPPWRASFQESLTVMAYAPNALPGLSMPAGLPGRRDCWPGVTREKQPLPRECVRTMNWAEADRPRDERDFLMGKHPAVRDARNYAAAELFRLTGEPRWHALFLATTDFASPNTAVSYHWDASTRAMPHGRMPGPIGPEWARRSSRIAAGPCP